MAGLGRDNDRIHHLGARHLRQIERGEWGVQGYLAHKKVPTPLGPPQGHRHEPTVGS